MPQELKDQQGNQPGKTFMPYTQTNYRMHPMGEPTDTRGGSSPWMRSLASSVGTLDTLPTNVPRDTSPFLATISPRSELSTLLKNLIIAKIHPDPSLLTFLPHRLRG